MEAHLEPPRPFLSSQSGESELLSEQALLADYQYTLRTYRALKRQTGAWRGAFASEHGRQPTVEDAERSCEEEFVLLYSTFLEVRARLLVELPRLRARMQQLPGGEQGEHATNKRHRGASVQDHSSVNANTSLGGSTGGATLANGGGSGSQAHPHPHPHPHSAQQQVTDSVATWLRADRYRRQRAVAAAAVAAAAAGATRAPAAGAGGALGDPAPGAAPSLQAAGPMTFQCVTAGSAARKLSVHSGSTGVLAARTDAWLPYQPVIQLTPVEQRMQVGGTSGPHPRARAGAAGLDAGSQAGDAATWGGGGDGDLGRSGPGATALGGGLGSAGAAAPLPDPPGAQAPSPTHPTRVGRAAQGPPGDGHECMPGAPGAADTQVAPAAAAASPLAPAPAPSRRLEEDAHLAADARTKNALLAALQYKRTAKAAGGGKEAGGGGAESGGGSAVGQGGGRGDGGDGKGGAQAKVEVEVRRGDAVGAYSGRNRRVEELPESFMVCP